MNVPIVAGTEVQTSSSGVKLDSGALRESALAPGKLAAAIGEDVGGLFQDVSQKIQANRNARTLFQADLQMRKAKDDFTASLRKMPDETTWLPAYKEQVDSVRQNIMEGPNVGPEVRKVLSQKFDTWEAATTAEVRTAALLKGAKETRQDAITDATYIASHANNDDDLKAAHAVLQHAVDSYAMSAADAHKLGARLPSIAAQSQADTAIATNPIKAPELIERFRNVIDPRVFVGVMTHANEARNRAQAQNVNELAMQMDETPDGTIDPGLLKEKVKAGEITQRAADGLTARMKKEKTAQSQNDFTVAAMQVHDHDFTTDKNPEETARGMKDENAHLPAALRLRLYKDIDARLASAKKKGEAEERPAEAQILAQMKKDRETEGVFFPSAPLGNDETQYGHLSGGLTALKKMKDEEVKTLYGVSKEKVMEAEKLHAAQMQGKMRNWFKDPANKDATIEQANAFRMKLEQPFVHAAAKAALNGSPGGSELANLLKKYGQ